MKKVIMLLTMAIIMMGSVFAALQFGLSDYLVEMGKGDSKTVTITATNNGVPVANVGLDIYQFCREESGSAYSYRCDSGDTLSPSELKVTVDPKTDGSGQATITIKHDGSNNIGNYHYTVCTTVDNKCYRGGASVTGDVSIPEFTTIGAGLALIGACSIYLKKRKK